MALPERTCVGCGEKQPATALVRLRVAPDGVVVDRDRRGGRGAWLHERDACLARAVKRRSFERAFRSAVAVDERRIRQQLTGNGGKA